MTAHPGNGSEADRRFAERRAMWDSFQEALTLALTFVAAPMLLGLLGWWIDGLLGTSPVFAVGLAAFGLAGVFVHAYYFYKARVAAEEEGKPWTRGRR